MTEAMSTTERAAATRGPDHLASAGQVQLSPKPNGVSAIEYGDSIIGGTYHESINGLHKSTLEVEGTFRLRRVNNSPVLNQ